MFLLIPFLVFPDFFSPPFCTCLWDDKIFAPFVAVPKTAMNKDDRFVFRKDDVRFTGQVFRIYPVTETFTKEETLDILKIRYILSTKEVFPDKKLWLGVFCLDPGHIIAPGFLGMNVGHRVLKYSNYFFVMYLIRCL